MSPVQLRRHREMLKTSNNFKSEKIKKLFKHPCSYYLKLLGMYMSLCYITWDFKLQMQLKTLITKTLSQSSLSPTLELAKCWGNASQINTCHRRGRESLSSLRNNDERAGITGENCPQHSLSAEQPVLKLHLNKNTFLSELATIDLECEMEME